MHCLPFASTRVHLGLVGSVLLIYLVFLCCPNSCRYVLSSVLWCPLPFPYKNNVRFVLTFSAVCRRANVLYTLFALLAHSGVQHILRCVFIRLVYHMLVVSLDCSFFIAPSVFSKVCVCWLLVSRFCLQFHCHWICDKNNNIIYLFS